LIIVVPGSRLADILTLVLMERSGLNGKPYQLSRLAASLPSPTTLVDVT